MDGWMDEPEEDEDEEEEAEEERLPILYTP